MEKFSRVLIGFGIGITLWVWLFESSGDIDREALSDVLVVAAFMLMIAVPWIVLLVLHVKKINKVGVMISAIPMALFEVMAYHTTFVNSQSSTATLIYVVKPFYQLIFMAVGLLIGWAFNKGVKRA